jgi:pyruvate/2-oxoglutarate dehydrogenase complex dihydrolipoamide dehydrogenase (E3) component
MQYQLVIIGGGTAAIAAISEAMELGAEKIAYIEQRSRIGGECAMNACAPLHTMMVGAKAFHGFRTASEFGINVPPLRLNFAEMMEKVAQTVEEGLEDPFAETEQVVFHHGHGTFLNPHEIRVTSEMGETVIRGEQILVATGARPWIPEIPGLKEAGYWLYPDATHACTLPDSLAIIGGGRIGVECAQLFQRLGVRVTLIESQDRLLWREDDDVSAVMRQLLENEGVQVFTNTEIVKAEAREVGRKGPRKNLCLLRSGQEACEVPVEEILVAAGRHGVPHDLKLEAAGVAYDAGGITIDDRCRTSVPHIFAAGDVVGPYRYTHAANYQAVAAVQNMMKAKDTRLNYTCMPLAIYTDPPLGRVGMTEAQARDNFQSVVVLLRPLETVSRFRLEGKTFGLAKIIIDADTDQILGAHLIAPQADDAIHLLALAMQNGITVPQMANLVYAYPTHVQIVQKTLELYRKAKAEALIVEAKSVHHVG